MQDAIDQIDEAVRRGENDRAITLAQTAADLGDPVVLRRMAEWRLIGAPLSRDVLAARDLYARARARGDVLAAHAEIALTANGCWGPADWATALGLLRQLAQRDADARNDLSLVEAMDIDDTGMPLRLPTAETLSDASRVEIMHGFLTPQECAHLARTGAPLLAPSVVADPVTGRNIRHPVRTSSAATIAPTRESLPIRAIKLRIAAATQTTPPQLEPLTLLHYAPGEGYRKHMDTLPGVDNQRIKTVILVLNEAFVGGATYFHATGLTVKGRAGDALSFDNVDREGLPDPLSVHEGMTVTAGAKWVATCWIRSRPLELWDNSN